MTDNKEQVLKDITRKIRAISPYKAIIFGSAITDKFHKDSDIDLVVILNKKGIAKTYKERMENRKLFFKIAKGYTQKDSYRFIRLYQRRMEASSKKR